VHRHAGARRCAKLGQLLAAPQFESLLSESFCNLPFAAQIVAVEKMFLKRNGKAHAYSPVKSRTT
jgi:hypothetical protein